MTTASLTQQKQGGFYHNRVNISHTSFKGQASKHTTVNWNICKKTGEQLTALFLSLKLVVYANDVYWHE